MARVCDYTGKKTSTGRNVSHSKRRTLREFRPNLFYRNITCPTTWTVYRLRLSAKAIRTMNKKWVESFLADLKRNKVIA